MYNSALNSHLRSLTKLCTLNLANNAIGSTCPEGITALLDVLPQLPNLKNVILEGNNIVNVNWTQAAAALAQINNRKLQTACYDERCFGQSIASVSQNCSAVTSAASRLQPPLLLTWPFYLLRYLSQQMSPDFQDVPAVVDNALASNDIFYDANTTFETQWHWQDHFLQVLYIRRSMFEFHSICNVNHCPEPPVACYIETLIDTHTQTVQQSILGDCTATDQNLATGLAQSQYRLFGETHSTSSSDGFYLLTLSVDVSVSSGLLLLARDVLLDQGYSLRTAERAAQAIHHGFTLIRMLGALYRGASYTLALLPLCLSMLTYHALTKTQLTSTSTALLCSQGVSIGTAYYAGTGLFHSVFSLAAAAGIHQVVSLGEEAFANRYLVRGLKTKCANLNSAYQKLVDENEIPFPYRQTAKDTLHDLNHRIEQHPLMSHYAEVDAWQQRLEEMQTKSSHRQNTPIIH